MKIELKIDKTNEKGTNNSPTNMIKMISKFLFVKSKAPFLKKSTVNNAKKRSRAITQRIARSNSLKKTKSLSVQSK